MFRAPAELWRRRSSRSSRAGAGDPIHDPGMPSGLVLTIILLTASNVFMTFAWYAHPKNLSDRPWYIAANVSWGIALFEYVLQVPANRVGYQTLSLAQLKILQDVITLSVFVPFAVLLHAAAAQPELPVGGSLPARGRVLHVPQLSLRASSVRQRPGGAPDRAASAGRRSHD